MFVSVFSLIFHICMHFKNFLGMNSPCNVPAKWMHVCNVIRSHKINHITMPYLPRAQPDDGHICPGIQLHRRCHGEREIKHELFQQNSPKPVQRRRWRSSQAAAALDRLLRSEHNLCRGSDVGLRQWTFTNKTLFWEKKNRLLFAISVVYYKI